MSVVKLLTENFRNLAGDSLNFHPSHNFIIGDNGSGKSSLLEAIFYLAHGKSYRTSKSLNIVTHDKKDFIVSIKDSHDKQLGISRNFTNSITTIKIDGEQKKRLSELAKNIAVQIITPESFKLFFGGPKERRRFIDLGLFHVKHEFSHQWREFSHVLKQRNACLRASNAETMVDYWTDVFCQHSDLVDQSRTEYVSALIAELNVWLKILLPDLSNEINVQFLHGWHLHKSLPDVLKANRARELQQGFSLYGAHKFDVKLLVNKTPIDMMLSRGQQKLFLLALTFAQAKLIEQVNRVKPILLIDDVGAELDLSSRTRLAQAIKQLNCQVVITAIDEQVLLPLIPDNNNYKMFHVKHGKVLAMDTTLN